MKLTLGNVSIPFHNPVEKRVGARACLPRGSCPPQGPALSPRAGTALGHLPQIALSLRMSWPQKNSTGGRMGSGCTVWEAAAAQGRWQKGGAGRGAKHLFLQWLFYSRPLELGQLSSGTRSLFCWGWLHSCSLFIAAVSAAMAFTNKQDLKLPSSCGGQGVRRSRRTP